MRKLKLYPKNFETILNTGEDAANFIVVDPAGEYLVKAPIFVSYDTISNTKEL